MPPARKRLAETGRSAPALPTFSNDAAMNLKTLFVASTGFEAARHVDMLPVGHRSRRLHGHSFLAKVRCSLPGDWASFSGAEVAGLRKALELQIAQLDYSQLNDRSATHRREHRALASAAPQGSRYPTSGYPEHTA